MKFYNTHFENYLESSDLCSLHPNLLSYYKTFPISISEFKNIIFYGPKGVGKYTQVLSAIRKYSPTDLKYEKKISVTNQKNTYLFKISDIHFEIDMSLLGCNSKMLWNEIYNQIIDIILAKSKNVGIIVCKNFQNIHSELLEIFYSYMQTHFSSSIKLKFILICEQISFIPNNIINNCYLISVPRPSKTQYNKCLKNKLDKNIKLDEISNIKGLLASVNESIRPYELICTRIIKTMLDLENLRLLPLRDKLYEIFIYDLDIFECVWFIINYLIKNKNIHEKQIGKIIVKTITFLQYYNNNYRPIYHLESFICYLIINIHELDKCE